MMEDTSPEGFPQSFVLGDSSDRRKDWDLLLKRASHPPQAGDTTTNPSSPPRPSSSPSARTRARKLRAATTLLRENRLPAPHGPAHVEQANSIHHGGTTPHGAKPSATKPRASSKQPQPSCRRALLPRAICKQQNRLMTIRSHLYSHQHHTYLRNVWTVWTKAWRRATSLSLSERATARRPPPSALFTSCSESSAEEPGTQVSPAAAGSEGETSNQVPPPPLPPQMTRGPLRVLRKVPHPPPTTAQLQGNVTKAPLTTSTAPPHRAATSSPGAAKAAVASPHNPGMPPPLPPATAGEQLSTEGTAATPSNVCTGPQVFCFAGTLSLQSLLWRGYREPVLRHGQTCRCKVAPKLFSGTSEAADSEADLWSDDSETVIPTKDRRSRRKTSTLFQIEVTVVFSKIVITTVACVPVDMTVTLNAISK
ncbi:hypothetical protein MTO96_040666 [Rhipicephalus appendiculatus]